MKPIPYARQDISEADIDAVVEVLRSDWLTQGPAIEGFERTVATRVQAGYATATGNATQALHLACRALGLGPGDLLWTTPNTFVASANCALYCGADVDFVDIDPETYNLSPAKLADKLAEARLRGRLPKIVIPVHFSGQPCDMAAIHALASEYGFAVIEDASHAIGAEYKGKPVGCGAYSDITVFSFHPVKILTTGEGGMALTNRADLAQKLQMLRSHGITRDPALMEQPAEGGWYYEQLDLGFNYRITDIQAALGRSQLARLDQFIARRRTLAQNYSEMLAGLPLQLPAQLPGTASAWHLYVIRVPSEAAGHSRQSVYDKLRQSGILVNVHYIPVHLQPYYRRLGYKPGDFPEAERYYQEAISLPMFYGLAEEEQRRVIATLEEILR